MPYPCRALRDRVGNLTFAPPLPELSESRTGNQHPCIAIPIEQGPTRAPLKPAFGLSGDVQIPFLTLSSRPEQIIAKAMIRGVEGPGVFLGQWTGRDRVRTDTAKTRTSGTKTFSISSTAPSRPGIPMQTGFVYSRSGALIPRIDAAT